MSAAQGLLDLAKDNVAQTVLSKRERGHGEVQMEIAIANQVLYLSVCLSVCVCLPSVCLPACLCVCLNATTRVLIVTTS